MKTLIGGVLALLMFASMVVADCHPGHPAPAPAVAPGDPGAPPKQPLSPQGEEAVLGGGRQQPAGGPVVPVQTGDPTGGTSNVGPDELRADAQAARRAAENAAARAATLQGSLHSVQAELRRLQGLRRPSAVQRARVRILRVADQGLRRDLSTLTHRVEAVRGAVRVHRRTLNRHEARLDAHEVSIRNLKGGVAGLKGDVSSLDGRVDRIETWRSEVADPKLASVGVPTPPAAAASAAATPGASASASASAATTATPPAATVGGGNTMNIPAWLIWIVAGAVALYVIQRLVRPRFTPARLNQYINALRAAPVRPRATVNWDENEGAWGSFEIR